MPSRGSGLARVRRAPTRRAAARTARHPPVPPENPNTNSYNIHIPLQQVCERQNRRRERCARLQWSCKFRNSARVDKAKFRMTAHQKRSDRYSQQNRQVVLTQTILNWKNHTTRYQGENQCCPNPFLKAMEGSTFKPLQAFVTRVEKKSSSHSQKATF